MAEKALIRQLIIDFHERQLPKYTPRMADLTCPENKIRCLVGVRRSGKTFTFYQLIHELLQQGVDKRKILYINFEDERLLPLSTSDFSLILNTYYEIYPKFKEEKVYLFFDEIQNIQHWEKFIRRILDTENVQINLTGSSSKLLSREIATSLRGRTFSYEIFPFGFDEFLRYKNIPWKLISSKAQAQVTNAFETYLYRGGFPEIFDYKEEFRLKTLQEYFNLILYKDLVERHDIRNQAFMKYLLRFLMSNTANPFTANKFYNDSKSQGFQISKDAIHNYLSHLEDAYCLSLVPIFLESYRARQVNYRKIYAIDHGMVTAISGSHSYNTGRLLETMVYNQLRRKYDREEVFYYRTSKGAEIDFVTIEQNFVTQIVQVSQQLTDQTTRKREIGALLSAMHELELFEATVVTQDTEETISQDDKTIHIIPFYTWILGKSPMDKL